MIEVATSTWHHMKCGCCEKWWAVEDAPHGRRAWFCPWCGQRQDTNEDNTHESRDD